MALNCRVTQYMLSTHILSFSVSQVCCLQSIPVSTLLCFHFATGFLFLSALTLSLLPISLLPLCFFLCLLHDSVPHFFFFLDPMQIFHFFLVGNGFVENLTLPLSVNRILFSFSNLQMGSSLVLIPSPTPRGLEKFDCAYP